MTKLCFCFTALFAIFCSQVLSGDSANSDRSHQFYCPNQKVPRMDERTGGPVQCLPGRNSAAVCGSGYSCFFSGFNYLCCPGSSDYDEEAVGEEAPLPLKPEEKSAADESEEECPVGSFSALDARGNALRCGNERREGGCPKSGMFCHGSTVPICCERFDVLPESPPKSTKIEKPAAVDVNIDIGSDQQWKKGIRLPAAAVALSESGTAHPPSQRPTGPSVDDQIPFEAVPNPGNEEPSAFADNEKGEGVKAIAGSEPAPPMPPSSFKIQATKVKELKDEETGAEPDNEKGGYAPARQLGNPNAKIEEQSEIGKQYLLEQIKQGWPYADKFYRPGSEDIIVLRKSGRPTAIVHFPNK